jgi:hypothetical protein
MLDWRPIDQRRIRAQHRKLYDSYDPDMHDEVDLDALELVDQSTGLEIPIYNSAGFRVPHRAGVASQISHRHGLLMDLHKIGQLFERSEHADLDLDDGDNVSPPTSYDIFPQAFLKSYGHFQASGLVHGFHKIITDVNRSVGQPVQITDNDGDDYVADSQDEDTAIAEATRFRAAVAAVASQGYNELVHRTRGHGGHQHDAQLGLVTAALAGSYARTTTAIAKRERLRTHCDIDLPHERFAHKIESDVTNCDFRLENIYTIDISTLRPSAQTGRSVVYISTHQR